MRKVGNSLKAGELKIILHYHSGSMNDIASRTRANLDFSDVWNIDDGMVEGAVEGSRYTS